MTLQWLDEKKTLGGVDTRDWVVDVQWLLVSDSVYLVLLLHNGLIGRDGVGRRGRRAAVWSHVVLAWKPLRRLRSESAFDHLGLAGRENITEQRLLEDV